MSYKLKQIAKGRMRVGIDAKLFSKKQVDTLKSVKEIELVINNENCIVDQIIPRKEEKQSVNFFDHEVKYCGLDKLEKIGKVIEKMD